MEIGVGCEETVVAPVCVGDLGLHLEFSSFFCSSWQESVLEMQERRLLLPPQVSACHHRKEPELDHQALVENIESLG